MIIIVTSPVEAEISVALNVILKHLRTIKTDEYVIEYFSGQQCVLGSEKYLWR
jgi:hypothetical protein